MKFTARFLRISLLLYLTKFVWLSEVRARDASAALPYLRRVQAIVWHRAKFLPREYLARNRTSTLSRRNWTPVNFGPEPTTQDPSGGEVIDLDVSSPNHRVTHKPSLWPLVSGRTGPLGTLRPACRWDRGSRGGRRGNKRHELWAALPRSLSGSRIDSLSTRHRDHCETAIAMGVPART